MNVTVIISEDPESCCNCEYADLYIPSYTRNYADPYCLKGHGQCQVGKHCDDYKNIREICGNCRNICKEHNKFICNRTGEEIEYNNRTCDHFQKK